jgi:hypothetical protein
VLDKAQSCSSEQVIQFAAMAKTRCNRFLDRVKIKEIDILSDTNSAPYPDITSESYMNFREQLARDSIHLLRLIEMGERAYELGGNKHES